MAGGLPHPVLLSTIFDLDYVTIGGKLVEFKHVFFTWLGMAFLFYVAYRVRNNITMVPGKLQNVFETIIGTIDDFVCTNLGEKDGPKFVPLLSVIFIYLITLNLIGLIPGCDAPTANLNTTVSMALIVFVYYNFIGMQRWGFHYINHFTGPSKALIPLMLPLEIVSHMSRPLSLSLRLFGNIRGEEIVIILAFVMAPILSSLPIYTLFLLGKSMQAFVFFMLTMFYIKGSLEHAH